MIRLPFHFYAHSPVSMPAISVRACVRVLCVRASVLRLCVSLGLAGYRALPDTMLCGILANIAPCSVLHLRRRVIRRNDRLRWRKM